MHLLAQLIGQQLPAFPIVFGHAVFDGDDRVLVAPGSQQVGEFLRGQRNAAFTGQRVLAVAVELGAGAVQAQGDLRARLVAGFGNGLQDQLDGGFMAGHVGRETALVAHCRGHALAVDQLLEHVEDFGAPAQGFTEAARAHRQDHQFLEVERVVGVRAAVDDVHHRHGHAHGAAAAEIAIQGQAGFVGGGAGHGHAGRQDGVGAQAFLGFGAVQLDQGAIDEGLFLGVQAHQGFRDFRIQVLDSAQHALAQITALVAIAQFDGFAGAGGSARRHGRAAHGAGFQQHIAFHGGVAARIQNLAADDIDDCTHDFTFPER
ncbi:hypothetical protein FQZ97_682050 [compost metagenome]